MPSPKDGYIISNYKTTFSMDAILNLLSAEQIDFIISAYGSVTDWVTIYGDTLSIAIEDMIL